MRVVWYIKIIRKNIKKIIFFNTNTHLKIIFKKTTAPPNCHVSIQSWKQQIPSIFIVPFIFLAETPPQITCRLFLQASRVNHKKSLDNSSRTTPTTTPPSPLPPFRALYIYSFPNNQNTTRLTFSLSLNSHFFSLFFQKKNSLFTYNQKEAPKDCLFFEKISEENLKWVKMNGLSLFKRASRAFDDYPSLAKLIVVCTVR